MHTPLAQPAREMDLRAIPLRERHALIARQLDALAAGEVLELINDHDPQLLRYQFEDRAAGPFEWVALEAGPAMWLIQITRVAEAVKRSAGSGACCSSCICCS